MKNGEGSHDIEIVPLDCFELERLIGDVCRSLEAAEELGDGMLDAL